MQPGQVVVWDAGMLGHVLPCSVLKQQAHSERRLLSPQQCPHIAVLVTWGTAGVLERQE